MKCTIILRGFQRFDEGTKSKIFTRLKFWLFVIVIHNLKSVKEGYDPTIISFFGFLVRPAGFEPAAESFLRYNQF